MTNETRRNRTTDTDADLESDARDAPEQPQEIAPFGSQVRVTFYHSRKQLADIDGLSGKAVLDGIVEAGILATDSPKQVTEVRHRQEKNRVERTVVVIEEVEG